LRLDIPSLLNTRRTLDHLERLGVSRERVQLVANRYRQPKELPAGKAEKALGVKISHYVPDDAKTITRAANSGIPAVLDAPSHRISRSFARLAVSINGHHTWRR